MIESTHTKNLVENVASQPFNFVPPEMMPASIEALRSVIGGFVWVKYDPRTIGHAPWQSAYRPEEKKLNVGYSVGMSDDLPDQMAILVRPHFVPDLFEHDEGRNQGEIVIPYHSIQMIQTLVADGEEFSFSNVPTASSETATETKDATR